MLIALLSNIHGNREAPEAYLDHSTAVRGRRLMFLVML